jgi:hypothetical protein
MLEEIVSPGAEDERVLVVAKGFAAIRALKVAGEILPIPHSDEQQRLGRLFRGSAANAGPNDSASPS